MGKPIEGGRIGGGGRDGRMCLKGKRQCDEKE